MRFKKYILKEYRIYFQLPTRANNSIIKQGVEMLI